MLAHLTPQAARRLERELQEPANFGMAKSFVLLGVSAGFDMESPEGMQAWVQAYKLSTETTQDLDQRGTTGSLGEVMRQVVEENVQPCSEQPSQIQTQLGSEPISPALSPAEALQTQQSRRGRGV